MSKIVIYTMTSCPKCKILEKKMIENDIDFQSINLENNNDMMQQVVAKGYDSTPILEVDNKMFNFSEAIQWIKNREQE